MAFEELINEELKFARYEYQIKFKADVSDRDLIALGAKKLGVVFHEDRFFIASGQDIKKAEELIRIRKEGEEDLIFTYKGPVANLRMRNRLVINKQISAEEIDLIIKNNREVITINKKRSIFILGGVKILLDHVDYLGSFIEFDVEKEGDYGLIDPILKKLNLDPNDAIKLSYFELALIRVSFLKKTLFGLYYKLEKIAFGISSAVMTVLGIIIGLTSAQQPINAILGAIGSVAVADSMADAVGVYTEKRSEKGASSKVALRKGIYTFFSKLIFSSSFFFIFLFLSMEKGIIASFIWGMIILGFINFLISYARGERIVINILKNISIAVAIVFISYLTGNLISSR